MCLFAMQNRPKKQGKTIVVLLGSSLRGVLSRIERVRFRNQRNRCHRARSSPVVLLRLGIEI